LPNGKALSTGKPLPVVEVVEDELLAVDGAYLRRLVEEFGDGTLVRVRRVVYHPFV
jgi:hypothetical protein